jgi:hypothetical protein
VAATGKLRTKKSNAKVLIAICDEDPFKPTLPAYTLNEEPQPQVLFTFGFSNLKPAPSRVST